MADKLEIGVVAETDDAKSGLDDLSKSIEDVGDAAEKASDQASKSTFEWADANANLKRSLPTAKDAAGTQAVATATIAASKATAIAQTRFQKLADTMRNFGRTAVRNITAGFSGLVGAMATFGRAAGRALAAGFAIGAGVIGLAILAIGKLLQKIVGYAERAGKEAAKALTDAFSSGLTLEELTSLQGAFADMLPDPDDARNAAKALGELAAEMRKNSDAAKQAQDAANLLGVDLKALTAGGKSTVEQLVKLQETYKKMDQIQQRDLLKLLFPTAPDETLAQIDAALEGTREKLVLFGESAAQNAAKIQAQIDKQRELGEASRDLDTAMSGLLTTIQEVTGLDVSWDNLSLSALQLATATVVKVREGIGALPAAISLAITAFSDFAQAVQDKITGACDAAIQAFEDFKTAVGDLASAAWDGIVSGINSIISVIGGLVSSIGDAIDAFNKLQRAGELGALAGGMVGPPRQQLQPQFRGLLAPAGGGGASLRAAQDAATRQSNLMGRAAPRAANDNVLGFGPAQSKQLDDILWRWKEISKESKKAGDAVAASAAQQTAALATVNQQLDVNALAQAMSNEQLVNWAAGVLQASDSTFEYRAALAQLDEALKRGVISAEQYGVALQQLQADLGGGGMSDAVQNLTDDLISFGESAADAFLDAALNGEDFGKVIQGLVKDLAKLIIKALIIQPLLDSISSAFGGIGGFAAPAGGVPLSASAAAQSGLGRAGDSLSSMSSNITGRRNRAGGFGGDAGAVTNNVGDINIDMTGTGMVTGSTEDARKLGLMVQRSVENILVQESRPGGLLRRAA